LPRVQQILPYWCSAQNQMSDSAQRREDTTSSIA
jgi:hypothetical protein